MIDLAELRAVLSKAAPGPWYAVDGHKDARDGYLRRVRDDYDRDDVRYYQDDSGGQWTVSSSPDYAGWECDGGHPGYGIHRDDAEAIATMRNVIGPLLAELEAARECIRLLRRIRNTRGLESEDSASASAALSAYDAATNGGG